MIAREVATVGSAMLTKLAASFVISVLTLSSAANACDPGDPSIATAGKITSAWTVTQHPLLGTVLRDGRSWPPAEIKRGTPCGDQTALSEMARTLAVALAERGAVVVMGEMHDNPDHHRIRALLAGAMRGPSKAAQGVVFEQLDADKADALSAFNASSTATTDIPTLADFKRAVAWDASDWSRYNYDPLFQTALDNKLPIYAGDVTREMIMKTAKGGETKLPEDERRRLGLTTPLGAKLDDASLTEIEGSHCGMMPKAAFTGMAFAQRYRDAHLADVTLKAADSNGAAILFAGNGHTRTDRGVPWYIRQRAPDRKVVAVMLVEVEAGNTDPEAYVPRDPDGKAAADYIVFTPSFDRPDPCEQMKARKAK